MEDRSMPQATRADFEDIIRKTDPGEVEDSEGWRARLMLLCSLKVGQEPSDLASFSGVSLPEITLFVQRLCENAIWIGGEWVNCNPWSGEGSGIDLSISVNVALGYATYDPVKEIFRLTPRGVERAIGLISRTGGNGTSG